MRAPTANGYDHDYTPRTRRETGALKRAGAWIALVVGTLTILALVVRVTLAYADGMQRKADATDLETLAGEVRHLRGDVRAIANELGVDLTRREDR